MAASLDVYFAAFVVPDTIFQLLVVGAVSASFIPIYQEYLPSLRNRPTKWPTPLSPWWVYFSLPSLS